MEFATDIHIPTCPNCEEDRTFPRQSWSPETLYTCSACGMIFDYDPETGETEPIKFDIVYDKERFIEMMNDQEKS